MDVDAIINNLKLELHVEGGYYRRTFCSELTYSTADDKQRNIMSTIYYLVTRKTQMSYFAVNKSDLVLYYHSGDPLKIIFVGANGVPYEEVLGLDLALGQCPQVICPGGVWKAYDLMAGEYCLVSEAVAPAFEYEDMSMPNANDLKRHAPDYYEQLKQFIKA